MLEILDWLVAFALTQAIEVPILSAALRHQRLGYSLWRRIALALGASAITHPIVWFVLAPLLRPISTAVFVVIAESFAVVVEAMYLRRLGVRDALLVSTLANAASWLLGRALLALLS